MASTQCSPPASRRRRSSAPPGGGIASPLWRQILADVLGAEIATVATTEGAAYGAALLAAVGAGWFASVDEAASTVVRSDAGGRAGRRRVGIRRGAHELYRSLYPALAPIFHREGSTAGAG